QEVPSSWRRGLGVVEPAQAGFAFQNGNSLPNATLRADHPRYWGAGGGRLPSLRAWRLLLWLAGGFGGAVVLLLQSRRLRLLLRNARPLRLEAVDILVQRLAALLGRMRAPGLKESAEVLSPFVAGYRLPAVVLPAGFADSLPEEELRAAL